MHRSEFLKLLKHEFPELTNDVNAGQGLLHFEVGVLKKYAQRAIYDRDREKFLKCLQLAEAAYREGNATLKDAIDVSFVEELEFTPSPKSNCAWAWEMMPNTLKTLYIAFHGSPKIKG